MEPIEILDRFNLLKCVLLLQQVLHFPPALYDYVVKELKKRVILVLNKVTSKPFFVSKTREYQHPPSPHVNCNRASKTV